MNIFINKNILLSYTYYYNYHRLCEGNDCMLLIIFVQKLKSLLDHIVLLFLRIAIHFSNSILPSPSYKSMIKFRPTETVSQFITSQNPYSL